MVLMFPFCCEWSESIVVVILTVLLWENHVEGARDFYCVRVSCRACVTLWPAYGQSSQQTEQTKFEAPDTCHAGTDGMAN